MFENIDKDKKLEILEAAKPLHERLLYESIVRLGIDPDGFDMDLFEGTEENYGLGNMEFCQNADKAIAALKMINREIASLES